MCANNWDANDAKVICRHLGYPDGDHIAVNDGRFGQGTGTIWLNNVKCDSSERNITECSLNSWVITRDCDRQASVICDPGIVLYVNGLIVIPYVQESGHKLLTVPGLVRVIGIIM